MSKNALFRFPGFDFDELFGDLPTLVEPSNSFPHYDMYKEEDGTFVVELAVAGFDRDAIEVFVENGRLVVKGSKTAESEDVKVVHRGIARRAFTKQFILGEHVKVDNASLDKGILRIELVKDIPEEKKPKRIAVL